MAKLNNEDSIHFPDSLRKETLILKRTVYGGGGIMPDYFVPLDTSFNSPYLTKIVAKGVVNEFASKYFEKHQDEMTKAYPYFELYNANFVMHEAGFQELIALATAEKFLLVKQNLINRSSSLKHN